VTKLDVLDELADIPVCTGYRVDGKKSSEIPSQISGYEKLECVYEQLPGWKTETSGISEYSKLPKACREYLDFLQKETGTKIAMVSTGPDRDQTIFLEDFSAAMNSMRSKPVAHKRKAK
jgi:adenylosuccinate synthase